MPITYNSGTDIIQVTGYSLATPCNFTDIYNADVAGSWGQVTRQCTDQFCFNCGLQIGDGSTATWFADTNKSVEFNVFNVPGWSTGYYAAMTAEANANVRIGEIMDTTNKIGYRGCFLYFNATGSFFGIIARASGNLEMYGSVLGGGIKYGSGSSSNPAHTGSLIVWGCRIDGTFYASTLGLDLNKNSVNRQGTSNSYGVFCGVATTLNNLDIYGSRSRGALSLRSTGGTINIKTLYVRDCDNICIVWGNTGTYNIINGDSDTWNVRRYYSGSEIIQKRFTVDLVLVDTTGSGLSTVKVKLWDKDNSLVVNVNTNASGVLTTQTITSAICPSGNSTFSTLKTPHEMRIYKYGKSMLSSKSSIEAKIDWAFTMLTDDHITQTTEATVAAYTGITINHTTETITISSNHTLDEIYDYCQYDIIAATKQLDQTMHTVDGTNFISEYAFVVNTGITVTATDQKLSLVAPKMYSLSGTAQFTGIIATSGTTRIPIKLTGIVDGSRYWVGVSAGMTKIFDGTQSGTGDVTGYYEHTINTPVTIRVRKGSSSPKYLNYESFGTLYAAAAVFAISQVSDSIA